MKQYDEKIIENVINVIKDCQNNSDLHIELSSTLAEDLDIDSSDAICLIMELEDIYDIEIDEKSIEPLITVESVVRLIQEKIN